VHSEEHIVHGLLIVDQIMEARGWESPPVFGAIAEPRGGSDKYLDFQSIPMTGKVGGVPAQTREHWLQMLSDKVESDPMGSTLMVRSFPRLVALVFASQGYSLFTEDFDVLLAAKQTGRGPADHPGAVESRAVVAVDVWGRPYALFRERGKAIRQMCDPELNSNPATLLCLARIIRPAANRLSFNMKPLNDLIDRMKASEMSVLDQ
jgi:hypothetical protein